MLRVVVTTIEREVFSSDTVEKITIPTKDGEITVYPNHASLMSALGMGEVIIYPEGEEALPLFIDGGLLQVSQNTVELLANMAERAEELDEAKIEDARRKAEKLLEERPVDVDLAKVESSLQKELMKQKLVNKHRRRY